MRTLELGPGENPSMRGPDVTYLDIRQLDLPHLVVWDAENLPLPFPDNSFDLIIANAFLEHVSRFPRLMADLHRILAPGGELRAQVPHKDEELRSGPYPEHYRMFSERTFRIFEDSYLPRWRILRMRTIRIFEYVLGRDQPGTVIRCVPLRKLFYLLYFLPCLFGRYEIHVAMTPVKDENRISRRVAS